MMRRLHIMQERVEKTLNMGEEGNKCTRLPVQTFGSGISPPAAALRLIPRFSISARSQLGTAFFGAWAAGKAPATPTPASHAGNEYNVLTNTYQSSLSRETVSWDTEGEQFHGGNNASVMVTGYSSSFRLHLIIALD